MNIWILNHYAVPQQYYYLSRSYNFAKQLMARGDIVTIFAASSVHNSDVNLITDGSEYREMDEDGIHYVLFHGRQYEGTGKDRVINHIDVALKMDRLCPKFCKKFGNPDVIFASAGQSLTLVAGIRLAKKLKVKCISEVTDLWPESFVAYGLISKGNPLLKLLYKGEKWIYTKSDAVIFSMEGGRDYIIEKGWDTRHGGPVDLSKVYHINNGVDLEQFDYNREHYTFADIDLDDPNSFKVVYAGSIRKVNQVGILVDVAEELKKRDPACRIKILIYGTGDEQAPLKQEAKEKELENIIFKDNAEKKFIPYILSKSDLCLLHCQPTPISKYGMSLNKSFEYMAAGKPILMNFKAAYDYIEKNGCGWARDLTDPSLYADAMVAFLHMKEEDDKEYGEYRMSSRRTAQKYDIKTQTSILVSVFNRHISRC